MMIRNRIHRFWIEELGATAVEYALMVAGIALLISSTVFLFGNKLRAVFQRLASLF